MIDLVAFYLFRRHVAWSADDGARLGQGMGIFTGNRQSEVQNFDLARRRKPDVIRLDIPMQDPTIVCVCKTFCNLPGDLESPFRFHSGSFQQGLSQRLSFEKGHDKIWKSARRFINLAVDNVTIGSNVQNRNNAFGTQSGYIARLPFKPHSRFVIEFVSWVKHLDTNRSIQLRVDGAKHQPHPSSGNKLDDAISSQRTEIIRIDGRAQDPLDFLAGRTGVRNQALNAFRQGLDIG